MTIEIWQFIIILVVELLVVAIATFFITRKILSNQLKKNPPINENQIRAMLQQMGQSPSEKRVRQIMKAMNEAK